MKSLSCPISVILALSCEFTQKYANFSLKIMKNRENCHSHISWFTQIMKCEITFTLNSRKFRSWPITSRLYVNLQCCQWVFKNFNFAIRLLDQIETLKCNFCNNWPQLAKSCQSWSIAWSSNSNFKKIGNTNMVIKMFCANFMHH